MYNQVNCTLCDHESSTPGLFFLEVEQFLGGRQVTDVRGTCLESCPVGFFMDMTNPEAQECKQCNSPCATCVDAADKCLSCDGTQNRFYVFLNENTCHETCPDGTATDMANQKCFTCAENCKKCTGPDID